MSVTHTNQLPVPSMEQKLHRPLTVSSHELDESFHTHIAEGYWKWRELFQHDPQARIEQHPDFVLAELKFAQRLSHRPAFVSFAHVGREVVAAAILVPKSFGDGKKYGPSWKLRGYRLAGNQLLGSHDAALLEALLHEACRVLVQTRADFLMLEDLDVTSPLHSAIQSGVGGMRTYQPAAFQPHHRIEFGPNVRRPAKETPVTVDPTSESLLSSDNPYWAKFTSKRRGVLRRRVKQFENGRLERITQPDQVADFLAHAHEISKQSWQSELLGLRVRNDQRELEMFTTLALHGALRSYLLWQGDEPVSFCMGTQYNGVFSDEEVGFDRRKAEFGPGQVLMTLLIEDLLVEDTPQQVDFGFGDAEYKGLYGTHVSGSGPLWLLRPGLKSALIMSYINGRRSLVHGLRGVLARTGLLQWVKQRMKRGA